MFSAEPLAGGCVLSTFPERRRWGSKDLAQRDAGGSAHQVQARGTRPPKGKRTARPEQERTPRATPPRKHAATQKNRALNNGAWGALPPHPLQWGRTWSNMNKSNPPATKMKSNVTNKNKCVYR